MTKDRNGKDLTEAEVIKRCGKNTQKNYTEKILMTQISMMVLRSPRAWHYGVWTQVLP